MPVCAPLTCRYSQQVPISPLHGCPASDCSVLTVAGQSELLASPRTGSGPQDTSTSALLDLWWGGKRGREVFWLCAELSKHSRSCLGMGAVPGHGSDVPAPPSGRGSLLFPLAQAGSPFFFSPSPWHSAVSLPFQAPMTATKK